MRASSEVAGAALILGIITITVAFLYVSSYPTISKSEEYIRYRNSYFDLLELKDKIDRIRTGVEPKATATIKLTGVSISFRNEPIIVVDGVSYNVSSISISGRDWELIFENGAIIERRGKTVNMLSYPSVYFDEKLTMPIISFSGNISFAGRGACQITLSLENVTLIRGSSIKIITSNAKAWKDYFDSIGLNYSASGNEINITANSYVIFYEVGLK